MTEEGDLKATVQDYLQLLENQGKLCYLRLNAGCIVIEDDKTGEHRFFTGAKRGCADLLVLRAKSMRHYNDSCRVMFIELKSLKGKLSKNQIEFRELVERQMCEYHIARSFEDVQEILGHP